MTTVTLPDDDWGIISRLLMNSINHIRNSSNVSSNAISRLERMVRIKERIREQRHEDTK